MGRGSGDGAGAGKAEMASTEKSPTQGAGIGLPQGEVSAASQSQISVVDMALRHSENGTGTGPEPGKQPGTEEAPDDKAAPQDPGPGFAHIDGDISGTGYNNTKVDVVTVPCPGADPVQTWTFDYNADDYWAFPSSGGDIRRPTVAKLAGDTILSPAVDRPLPRAGHIWVRGSIRTSASTARVMLYRHRALSEGLTLERLARDLLDQVLQQRQGTVGCRPSKSESPF